MILQDNGSMESSKNPKAATSRRTPRCRLVSIFKSRRLWAIAVCCMGVVFGLVLMDHFVWYPNSPRGKLDLVQTGMSYEEAIAIVEDLEDLEEPILPGSRVAIVETWTPEGYERHSISGDKSYDIQRIAVLRRSGFTDSPRTIDVLTADGLLWIDCDNTGRVATKGFLGTAPRGILPRIRSWLGI